MQPTHGCFLRIVKLRVGVAILSQLLDAPRCSRTQIIEPSKDNRFGRTNFCARWNQSTFLSIVTEGALECPPVVGQRPGAAINHAKGAGNDAITAAITDIVLHKDRTDLGANDRTGRTGFETTGFFAVFANIGEKDPAKRVSVRRTILSATQFALPFKSRRQDCVRHRAGDLISLLPILFHEQDMSPRGCAEAACIVVGISAPLETVIGHIVPFFACDFAGFAADANGRISEEANFDVVFHV